MSGTGWKETHQEKLPNTLRAEVIKAIIIWRDVNTNIAKLTDYEDRKDAATILRSFFIDARVIDQVKCAVVDVLLEAEPWEKLFYEPAFLQGPNFSISYQGSGRVPTVEAQREVLFDQLFPDKDERQKVMDRLYPPEPSAES